MSNKLLNEQDLFLENIARKVWFQLNYANAVEQSLSEGSIKHLIVEEIDKAELEKLENMGKDASQAIDDMIADASSLGFEKTVKYLSGLKKEVPSTFNLVKMSLTGDAEKVAKEIGKVTTTTTKVNNVRDSFYDAVVLLGTELAKLEYSKDPEAAAQKAAEAAAEESDDGNVDTGTGESIPAEEAAEQAVDAFKTATLGDLSKNKFMTWVKGIKFPDESTLRKAAENSYKPAPEPEGFLGKVASFFGFGTLKPGDFADDIMATNLDKLIAKAQELKAKKEEAEKDEAAIEGVADDIEADLQDLAQGDADALAVGAGAAGGAAGGAGGAAGNITVQMPGAGAVPAAQIQQVVPGEKVDDEADLKGKKMVPMPELEKKVTAPEEVSDMTPELAALINDDPKSEIVIFDPEEAEEAAEEAEAKPEEAEDKPEESEDKPEDKKKEEWVHRGSLTNMLFEAKTRSKRKATKWAYRSTLSAELLSEAIMYKDLEKALKAQGIADDKMVQAASDLATRLENQYDVIITGIPVPEELEQAAEQVTGYTSEEVEARLAQEREFWAKQKEEDRKWAADFMTARDEQERERLALQKPPSFVFNQQLNQQMSMGADFVNAGPPAGEVDTSGVEEEAPAEEKEKFEKPEQELLDKAKELGVEYKEGENPDNLRRRIRRAEKKAKGESTKRVVSKETKQKARDKAEELGIPIKKGRKFLSHATLLKKIRDAEPEEAKKLEDETKKDAKKSGKKKSKASGSPSMSQSQSSETNISIGFGEFHEGAYYNPGRLAEALLGGKERLATRQKTSQETHRWLKLAGLKDE